MKIIDDRETQKTPKKTKTKKAQKRTRGTETIVKR